MKAPAAPILTSTDPIHALLAAGRLDEAEAACSALQDQDAGKAVGLEALGDARQKVRNWAGAADAYGAVLDLQPSRTPTRVKRAVTLIPQGKRDAAHAELTRAVQEDPSYAPGHLNLGVLLAESGSHAEAVAHLQKAVDLSPGYEEAHANLGKALSILGRFAQAVPHLKITMGTQPPSVASLVGLGTALWRAGEPGEAYPYLLHAHRIASRHPGLLSLLGEVATHLGRFEEAERWLDEALRKEPRSADLLCTLGSTCKAQGRIDEAFAHYEMALAYEPGKVRARWNRSLALLHKGNYEAGWADYDVRMLEPYAMRIATKKPIWDGSSLEGKTLLVHPEQGLGDVLQFARYVPLIKQRFGARRVVMMAPHPVIQVVRSCPGLDELILEDRDHSDFDEHVPLLSLPKRFGTTLANIPPAPYLFAEPDRVAKWREKMADIRGLRVGVVWTGNTHNSVNRFRAFPLYELEPVARVPGVQLVCLQRLFGRDQLATYGTGLGIIDPAPDMRDRPEDFADTAAIIANLDVVISMCTSVAHLAGAMGARTWLALSKNADWRWLERRPDSPWYPSVRIFRQADLDDWKPVFREIADCAAKLDAEKARRSPP